jgi:MFS family permease
MVDRSKAMNRELQTKNDRPKTKRSTDLISGRAPRSPKSDISVFKESNGNITRKTHATKATTQQKEPAIARLLECIPSRCAGWCWAISGYLPEILTKLEPSRIGMATAASSIATVIAQTPAGALIDRLRQKRMSIVLAAVLVSIGCMGIALLPAFPVIIACQVLIGGAAAVFPPAIAAIALGLVGHSRLDRRVGRNQSFNHAGNLLAATLAGLIGQFVARKGIFFLVAVMAIGSAISVLRIREKEIDHELARGATEDDEEDDRQEPHLEGILQLLSDRRVLFFALAVIL